MTPPLTFRTHVLIHVYTHTIRVQGESRLNFWQMTARCRLRSQVLIGYQKWKYFKKGGKKKKKEKGEGVGMNTNTAEQGGASDSKGSGKGSGAGKGGGNTDDDGAVKHSGKGSGASGAGKAYGVDEGVQEGEMIMMDGMNTDNLDTSIMKNNNVNSSSTANNNSKNSKGNGANDNDANNVNNTTNKEDEGKGRRVLSYPILNPADKDKVIDWSPDDLLIVFSYC